MTERCTWLDCKADKAWDEVGKDGSVWAKLCNVHHNELESVVASLDVKKLLSTWVKAKGGSKKATERMMK